MRISRGAITLLTRPRGRPTGLAAIAPELPVRHWVERRAVVLSAAAVSFAVIFGLRQVVSGEVEAVGLLYVVPISLVALELGATAGIIAAALALGLVGAWSLDSGVDLSLLGFVTRGVAYVLVGALGGLFGTRMRAVQNRQFLLLESGLRLAHLDDGHELTATLAKQAQQLVSSSWVRAELSEGPVAEVGAPKGRGVEERIPIEVRGTRYGTLSVRRSRPCSREDLATLEILALQAAVAAENWRLLASERERVIIRAELQDARVHLADRGGQLRELMARQEAERHHLAYELNEQAAQSLAAVLLGLAALERELGAGPATPRFGELRSDVDSTLRSLRSLAVSLRPPALELGLRTALERLAEAAPGRGFGEMDVALDDSERLAGEVETMVYRVVEEALAAVGAAHKVSVRARTGAGELLIDIEGAQQAISHERLAVLRARLELIGGTLTATPTELRAVIPLRRGENGLQPASGGGSSATRG
jgi:signal transduction histidine kinase